MKEKAKSSRHPVTVPPLKKKIRVSTVLMEDKSAEQLLEDLMGILSNRLELLEKIIKKFPGAHDGNRTFIQYRKQTKKFLSALKEEASAYGDALAGPDPENAYNDFWKAALKKWDSINHHRLIPFWRELETILRSIYQKMLPMTALPQTFQSILNEQLTELEAHLAK